MRRVALGLPGLLFGLAFFVWPMVAILTTGLRNDPERAWSAVASSGSVVWFTLWQAAVSTLITVAIGLPIAWILARFEFPGRATLRAVVTVPFVLPTVVVALAFLSLAGPRGALGVDLSGTAVAIVAAHVFFNIAVVVRTVGSLWSHIDPRMIHAAATLGAGRWRAFRTVTLPLLRPAILAASAIVFLFTSTSFGVVLLLGAPRLATIEVEIYRSAAQLFDLPAAAGLAVLQLIGVTAALVWYSRVQAGAATVQQLLPARAVARRPRGREKAAVAAIAGVASVISLAPIAAIVTRLLSTGSGPGSLSRIPSSVVDPWSAIGNSVRFGLVAMAIAIAVAIPAAVLTNTRRGAAAGWIDPLLMLPIGSSAVTLGFGFVVALDAPIDIRAWWAIVPIAHALVAIPLLLRMVGPVIGSISERLRAAAATLGATPARVWRSIDLPILSPAAAGAAALAFVVSLGEFGATLFVARPGGQTMTLAIFRLLGRPGDANLAAALTMSLLLVAITAATVLVIERLRVPGIGGF